MGWRTWEPASVTIRTENHYSKWVKGIGLWRREAKYVHQGPNEIIMIHVILDHGEVGFLGSMIATPVGKENKREWDFMCESEIWMFLWDSKQPQFQHETTHPMDRLRRWWFEWGINRMEAYTQLHSISRFPEWCALRRLQSWALRYDVNLHS